VLRLCQGEKESLQFEISTLKCYSKYEQKDISFKLTHLSHYVMIMLKTK